MILGITGSIGSGKTTAALLFKKAGFELIDADEVAHDIIKKNSVAYKEIVAYFGKGILDSRKNIDRKKLGKIVFNEKQKLEKLNSMTHPVIVKRIKNKIDLMREKKKNVKAIVDAPLLIETGVKNLVDRVAVVQTDMEHAMRRNKKFSREDIERIMQFQMSLKEKMRHADFVIDNNGTMDDLKKQVNIILERLKQ